MKVTLLVPTLNEIEGMKAIMPRIKREWCDQIVVVDGNSTDGTPEWATEQGYTVYKEQPGGLRSNILRLWPTFNDVVIEFSPDGNCIPELIPPLIAKMKEGYDMVIVSRYLQGAKSYDDTPTTCFGNWLFTNTVNVLHGGHYTDVMGIFRALKKNVLYDLDLDKTNAYSTPEKLFHTRISWEPLMSVRAAKRKLKVAEIPGDEPSRVGGKAKLQVVRWGAAYMFQVIREVFWW